MTPLENARATEHRIVAAKAAHHAAEGERASGVCWSGMDPAHYLPPTEAEIEVAARERAERRAQAEGSWESRLMAAIAYAQHDLAAANMALEAARSAINRADGSDVMAKVREAACCARMAAVMTDVAEQVVL